MKIIHKYIASSYINVFLAALLIITFVVSLGGIFKVIDLIAKGVEAAPILQLFSAGIPSAISIAIPLASLISVLLLFGRLSSDGEIMAMKACGMSLQQVSFYPLAVSAILSVACLAVTDRLAPLSHLKAKRIIDSLTTTSPMELIEEGRFMKDFVDGITLYVAKKSNDQLRDVRIFDSTSQDFTREIRAKRGTMSIDSNSIVQLNLFDVSITPFAKDKPDPAYADEWPLRLGDMMKHRKYEPKEDDWNSSELAKRIDDTRAFYPHLPDERIPIQNMILRVELNRRISMSVSCFAFVLLGIPLGIKAHRKESSAGIGLSLVLVMNLYLFIVIANSLAKQPKYHADLIVWIPVALASVVGIIMTRRAN